MEAASYSVSIFMEQVSKILFIIYIFLLFIVTQVRKGHLKVDYVSLEIKLNPM